MSDQVTSSAEAVEAPRPGLRVDTPTRASEHQRGARRPALPARLVPKYALVGAWAVVAAFYAIIEPSKFITHGTFDTIFGSQQPLVFLSLALVVTFVVGEFDLSVAFNLGLAATIVPVLSVVDHMNVVVASLVALVVSVVAGVVNGFVIVKLGVNAIVATLGMGTFLLGLAEEISHLETVSGISSAFSQIANHPVAGLPVSFFEGLFIAIVIAYVLGFTRTGRNMLFVGANAEVARLAGIRVQRIRFGSYVASGLLCGLGGVILAASLGGFTSGSSAQYLLPAFAGTFLGTAVVQPGRFNPIGSLIGIYFLVTGVVGLELLGYTGWVVNVFYGAALVIAVAVSTMVGRQALGSAGHPGR